MAKVEKVGTVWVANARVKVIDDSVCPPVWKTLATCIDTPRHVGVAVAKVRSKNPKASLWVFGDASGKKFLG